jgi:hypothetical protein
LGNPLVNPEPPAKPMAKHVFSTDWGT